jgi:LysM repeat protein
MYAATVTATPAHPAPTRTTSSRPARRRPDSVLAPLWVFAIVLALLVIAAALPTASGVTSASKATRRVRVAASDTLWSIARANPVAGLTTAESVALIRRLNGLDASVSIQPGAVIAVPCVDDADPGLAMR